MTDTTGRRRVQASRGSPRQAVTRLAASLLSVLVLAAPVAVEARRDRSTTQVNYHPNVIGTGASAQLEALDPNRTGLLGERSWILTIGELNASKGTHYADFEEWAASEPDDPVAGRIADMLQGGVLSPGGRTGDRGR